MRETYTIPALNGTAVIERIDKLNKAARKLKVAPITFDMEHSHWETYFRTARDQELNIESKREWLTLTVEGETPKLSGWSFAAVLHTTTEGNIVAAVPGMELPVRFRTSGAMCDHCRTSRNRSEVYVVFNDAGEYKQVGSSCLKDFLGHADPHAIARWAELLAQFSVSVREEEDHRGGRRYEEQWSLRSFLAVTQLVVRSTGFLGRAKAREINEQGGHARATVEWVLLWLADDTIWNKEDKAQLRKLLKDQAPTDEDRAVADAVIKWSETRFAAGTELNDYLHNLSMVTRAGIVTLKTAGLAASLITTYLRDQQQLEERQAEAKIGYNSAYVGEVGERITRQVTVLAIIAMAPTEWGTSQLVKMQDELGNIFIWFASSMPDCAAKDVRWIIGTVKKHETRNSVRQTVLTRCNFLTEDAVKAMEEKAARKAARLAKKTAKLGGK